MAVVPISMRLLLTLAFVGTGAYCLRHCVDTGLRGWSGVRISNGMHVLMSASMIAMIWVSLAIVAGYLAAAFVACSIWFAVRATGIPLRMASFVPDWPADRVRVAASGCGGSHRGERWRCVHHAVAMAAMGAMFLLPGMTGQRAMSGMSMGGIAPSATTASVMRIGVMYFGLAAGALAYVGLQRRGHRTHDGRHHDGVHALMTAGMATMIFAMS